MKCKSKNMKPLGKEAVDQLCEVLTSEEKSITDQSVTVQDVTIYFEIDEYILKFKTTRALNTEELKSLLIHVANNMLIT